MWLYGDTMMNPRPKEDPEILVLTGFEFDIRRTQLQRRGDGYWYRGKRVVIREEQFLPAASRAPQPVLRPLAQAILGALIGGSSASTAR
jgi:hypothetical protein